ncbi:MAG: helix-turn-helix domain-containing protein [Clostridia bacterium]|nr:helix-turn-helix domain-containing protein [Clostridia bacterium]
MLKNLKNVRKNRNMTQTELGEKVNVSQQVISDYERLRSNPRMPIRLQLAEVLNSTIEELTEDPEKPKHSYTLEELNESGLMVMEEFDSLSSAQKSVVIDKILKQYPNKKRKKAK